MDEVTLDDKLAVVEENYDQGLVPIVVLTYARGSIEQRFEQIAKYLIRKELWERWSALWDYMEQEGFSFEDQTSLTYERN